VINGRAAGCVFGPGNHEKSIAGWIDDRSSADAKFCARAGATRIHIFLRDCGNSVSDIDKTGLPKRGGHASVGIEGVYAVMLGGSVNNIVKYAGNLDVGHVERGSTQQAVDRIRNQFS